MRKGQKRRDPPYGAGLGKAAVRAGQAKANPGIAWTQAQDGTTFFPASQFQQLLSYAPKRYRILVQMDERGRTLDEYLVLDRETGAVAAFPIESLATVAETVGDEGIAARLRGIARAHAAERAGLEGAA